MFKRTRIKRIVRMLIKHLKQGTQAAEPTGLIRAIWMIRVLKKKQFVFKGTRIKRIDRMLIKHLKQGTQAKEPIGLIRAIRIIRVLKKSSLCLKEHEYSESTEY